MKLEDQCCSLELAKRLKELGVKQESLFYWEQVNDQDNFCVRWKDYLSGYDCPLYSAFTVAEFGELLPNNINDFYFTSHRCVRNGWWAMYRNVLTEQNKFEYWSKSEADVRAKILICLIENGLYKP